MPENTSMYVMLNASDSSIYNWQLYKVALESLQCVMSVFMLKLDVQVDGQNSAKDNYEEANTYTYAIKCNFSPYLCSNYICLVKRHRNWWEDATNEVCNTGCEDPPRRLSTFVRLLFLNLTQICAKKKHYSETGIKTSMLHQWWMRGKHEWCRCCLMCLAAEWVVKSLMCKDLSISSLWWLWMHSACVRVTFVWQNRNWNWQLDLLIAIFFVGGCSFTPAEPC